MDTLILARILHVLGVVIWIGGVGMVTMVVLPTVKSFHTGEAGGHMFEAVERRFAWIARAMTLIVGLSGLYMVWKLDLWERFAHLSFWWMHAMVAVWAVFTLILFVAEPLMHRKIAGQLQNDPERTFRRMQRVHWVLLLVSLITIAGALAGAHGVAFFASE